MPDHPTLSKASTPEKITEAVACFDWFERHRALCPAEHIPSEADLTAWQPNCSDAAQVEAREAATAMGLIDPAGDMPAVEQWRWQAMDGYEWKAMDGYEWKAMDATLREYIGDRVDADSVLATLESHGAIVKRPRLVFAAGLRRRANEAVRGVFVWDLVELHRRWAEIPNDNRPRHPLVPLVAAWQRSRPRQVDPERRQDRRILPCIRVRDGPPERQAGMLFGGLHEGRRIACPELPLWSEVAPAKRVPLLDLVDAAGLPVMARGKGVPLPLRLFVRALASVAPEHRSPSPVRLALTLGELRDGLWPNGWRIGQHWPELREALIHARDYAIHDGHGRWFPVALRYMPDAPALDDMIVLDIAFPDGSRSGPPVVLPDMGRLSVESAPRWRAYIAAHSVAWQPGITRVSAPKAGNRILWTRNRMAYPVLTLEDRRRLAFGAGDRKHRTRKVINDAFRDLPGLVVVSEHASNDRTGEVGWQVLPEDAARVVGKGDAE